ncbi:MAG: phosphoenolpyruvate synthase [Lewinellaceae bacterium]|nr:phosphoenolpyruvate synthase [Phaeodactylibacter sp.]MCB9348582.1 phosphoenolpyruvate synthase [Lewinellaceae bacterium]
MKTIQNLLFFFLLASLPTFLFAQKVDNERLKNVVKTYKADQRGPYKDIRWFCKDGTVVPPKERCPQPGGVQRARYKDEAIALGKEYHLYLGQILSTTPREDFWDADNYNSRLKQYQLGKYLQGVDNGWILRKAQYYRGAFQVEDEENWGNEFFKWLLAQDPVVEQQFFLVRQAAKDIPHEGDNNRAQLIRSLSKEISDAYPAFLDLRVKIHGQPEASDIPKVKNFRSQQRSQLSPELLKKLDALIREMEVAYEPVNLKSLNQHVQHLPKEAPLRGQLNDFIQEYPGLGAGAGRVAASSAVLWRIREQFQEVKGGRARMALTDISIALEEILFKEAIAWQPKTTAELLQKVSYLSQSAAGAGFIEQWEWQKISGKIMTPPSQEASLKELNQYLEAARRVVEWGAGTARAVYGDVINLYGGFEPLAYGFSDDRVRGSVLLPLGQSVGQLGDFLSQQAGLSNQVMDISNQSAIRGLNPGYAFGELVVLDELSEEASVDKNKIYIINHPPSDLKPVAGIATVSEGNLVSHVQLLARNLGIPNAVISPQNLESLRAFAGQKVFYAVSPKGTVIMKPERRMTEEEKQLFAVSTRSENRISVPADKIELGQRSVIDLRQVKSSDSGKLCGPKAANLGQLKRMFPDNVVEGLVIPFGIFRSHLDQPMPGTNVSYWAFLNNVFQQAAAQREEGATEEAVEKFLLRELETLRLAIKDIQLQPDFVAELKQCFIDIFGEKLGGVPVFLRSDTNMEDLKEFTGAGLNLTLFNVVDAEKILQGIKDVWASPYTERSYKWRQRYLLNPENVFPSILVIPSVDVEYSGVMITKGVTTGDADDITVAFSRGAGGAVDGQAAESYLLHKGGANELLAPAREPFFNRLPTSGGTQRQVATFQQPILNSSNLDALRTLAAEVRKVLPTAPGIETNGPFDVELGFKDNKIWLFQVRPFVENKRAASSAYLESITPEIPENKMISLQ